jgi:predicted cobalt transporter CbtA
VFTATFAGELKMNQSTVLAGVAAFALVLGAHAAAAEPGKAKPKEAAPASRPVTVATYGFEASATAPVRAEGRAAAADLQRIERARADSERLGASLTRAPLVARPDGSLKPRRD